MTLGFGWEAREYRSAGADRSETTWNCYVICCFVFGSASLTVAVGGDEVLLWASNSSSTISIS